MKDKATKKIQVEFQNKKKLSEEIDIALNWLESQELTPEEIAKKIRLEKKNYRFSKPDLSTTRNLKDKNKITVAIYPKEKLQNILQQLKQFIEDDYKFTWNELSRSYEDVNKKFNKTVSEDHLDVNWKAKASTLQGTWKGFSFNGYESGTSDDTFMNTFAIKVHSDLIVECNTEHTRSMRGSIYKIVDNIIGLDLYSTNEITNKIERKISIMVKIGHYKDYSTLNLLELAYLDSGSHIIRHGNAILIRSDIKFEDYNPRIFIIEKAMNEISEIEKLKNPNIENEIKKIAKLQYNLPSESTGKL